MNQISRILIPFNFSPSAEKALEYAISFGQNSGRSEIHLLYIANEEISKEEEKEVYDKFTEIVDRVHSMLSNHDIFYKLEKGDFVTKVLEVRQLTQAEIIIMGTKGAGANGAGKNTNTAQLIQKADCPVLVIPRSLEGFRIKNITLALDKYEIENPDCLVTLLEIARRYDATIHVLTIYGKDDEDYLKERKNEDILKYYFEKYYARSTSVRSDSIAKSIIEYDKRQAIDILAVIPRKHSKKGKPSEGRLTTYLAKSTDIPLLSMD